MQRCTLLECVSAVLLAVPLIVPAHKTRSVREETVDREMREVDERRNDARNETINVQDQDRMG